MPWLIAGSVTDRTVLPGVSGTAAEYTLTAWLPRVLPGGVFQSDVVATSPGYRTWLVQPQPGTLSWAEGQAPTPHGPLTVDWGHRSSDGEFATHVSAPTGTFG